MMLSVDIPEMRDELEKSRIFPGCGPGLAFLWHSVEDFEVT